MSTIGPGMRVMLIKGDGFMPPMGSRGVVISPVDGVGDCDVLFPGCPCPNPPDTSWVAHWSWLLPLDDGSEELRTEVPATSRTGSA